MCQAPGARGRVPPGRVPWAPEHPAGLVRSSCPARAWHARSTAAVARATTPPRHRARAQAAAIRRSRSARRPWAQRDQAMRTPSPDRGEHFKRNRRRHRSTVLVLRRRRWRVAGGGGWRRVATAGAARPRAHAHLPDAPTRVRAGGTTQMAPPSSSVPPDQRRQTGRPHRAPMRHAEPGRRQRKRVPNEIFPRRIKLNSRWLRLFLCFVSVRIRTVHPHQKRWMHLSRCPQGTTPHPHFRSPPPPLF